MPNILANVDRPARAVRTAVCSLVLCLSLVLLSTASRGEDAGPSHAQLTIIHPFAPGGVGYDLGQVIGDRFRRLYNIPVVVEAKPGANTVLGVTYVIKSAPDGQTLVINSASITAIAGVIYKAPPYDPVSDLTPVAFVAKVPLVLVVTADLPIKSLQDLVQFARKTPKGLSYASTGVGSAQHLIMEALKRELQIDMTHVPFRGPIPGLTAVAGGHTQLMLVDVLNAASLVESGKIRPIALTTATELDAFRDVSTFAQAGLNGLDADLRFMLFAPSKVPSPIVTRLNSNLREAFDDAAIRGRFAKLGVHVQPTPDPEHVGAMYRTEVGRWYRFVQSANLANTQ